MSDPSDAPTAFPVGLPKIYTDELTRRIRAISNTAASKPDLELAEVTAVSYASGITVKKIGTTVTIPGVKIVGWSGSCYPTVGEFVWLLTTENGAQPFAIGIPAPEQPRCKVYVNTTFASITNAFPGTPLAFNTNWTEEYKKLVTHDFVTNNTRLTIQRPGIYDIDGTITYDANNVGIRATTISVNGAGIKYKLDPAPTALFGCVVDVQLHMELAAGDYVEMLFMQNTGANLNILQGIGNTYLSVIRIADIG